MKIKHIISQTRRDFRAIYVCEHCEHEHEGRGYDDNNYHMFVIPQTKCGECGQVAPSNYRPLATKYPEGEVV